MEEADVELPVTKRVKEKTGTTTPPKKIQTLKKEKVDDDQESAGGQDDGQVEDQVVHVEEKMEEKATGVEEPGEENVPADEGVPELGDHNAVVDGDTEVDGDAEVEANDNGETWEPVSGENEFGIEANDDMVGRLWKPIRIIFS